MAHIDGEPTLFGNIEIDETYIGGRVRDGHMWSSNKTILMGMKQRGGDMITKVIPDTRRETMIPLIRKYVDKNSSIIYTDEHGTYSILKSLGYKHKKVNHKQNQYAIGNIHTNTIEGYWSQLKRSIKSTHTHVSKKYLEHYAEEFKYRYNRRQFPDSILQDLLVNL